MPFSCSERKLQGRCPWGAGGSPQAKGRRCLGTDPGLLGVSLMGRGWILMRRNSSSEETLYEPPAAAKSCVPAQTALCHLAAISRSPGLWQGLLVHAPAAEGGEIKICTLCSEAFCFIQLWRY